jgi:DNA primase
MASLEFVTDYVLQNVPKTKITKNGTHFTGRCPLCGDSAKSQSKKRFNLDWNNGRPMFHCFNCGESGSFLDFYSQIEGISRGHAYKILYEHDVSQYDSKSIREKYAEERMEEIVEETFIFQDILSDCLAPGDKAGGYVTQKFQNYLLNFIKDRKIPKSIKIFVAYKGKYKGRIIIPIYDDKNNLTYFQGRAVNDSIKPKYLNPDLDKTTIIYNVSRFERDKFIIVTEGLLDAFMVPPQGTASLGSSITEEFIKELLTKSDKGVILAFDNDVPGMKSMLKFIEDNKYSNLVKYFLFPNKYSTDEDLNALVTNNVNILANDLYDMVVDNSHSRVATEAILRLRRNLL